MNTEIEMKARIESPEDVKAAITDQGAKFLRSYEKSDSYYVLRVSKKDIRDVRLRIDDNNAIVTMKEKRLNRGLETNREREFTVSDADHFTYFLKQSGYELDISKHKSGQAWKYGEYLLELSHIQKLGWFLEIERVVNGEADEHMIESSRAEIREMFTGLGIPESAIESRRYTAMLREKARS